MTTEVENTVSLDPMTHTRAPSLSKELCYQLWCRMVDRLHQGESLYTIKHYQQAMEEEFYAITQTPASSSVKHFLHTMITLVNEKYPRTYMAAGLQNCLSKVFEKNVEKLNWALGDVQTKGTRALKTFLKRNMHELFVEAGVKIQMIDPALCVRAVAVRMTQEAPLNSPIEPLAISDTSFEPTPAPPTASPVPPRPTIPREIHRAIEAGSLDAAEVEEWTVDQSKLHAEIEQSELAKIPQYADSYVKRGLLTQVEANNLVKTYSEEDIKKINKDEIQTKLKAKIRPALDYTTLYIEVFQALRRIPEERDEALIFLIRYKDLVIAQNTDVDFSEVAETLAQDPALVDNLNHLMARKDQEVRMIYSKLPPYGQVVKRNEKIPNLIIEDGFIKALRTKDSDEFSEILNDPDMDTRIRPAADMKCLIMLIDQLSTTSRFIQEIRIAKANLEIETIYKATKGKDKARNKVEHFLNRRLNYMFPDLKPYEQEKIERFSKELLEQKKKPKPKPKDEDELSEEEIKKGIQLTRVEVRIAGRNKRVPYKIMEDPQEQGKHIILKRDTSTGELIPALNRGKKRYVEKDKDGFWKAI